MLISKLLQNKNLSPYFIPNTLPPTGKKYNKHLLPNSIITKNPKNQFFIQFKCHIPKQQFQLIEDKLLALVEINKHEQFIRMRYFSVKEQGSNKDNQLVVFVYFEYLASQIQELDRFVRRKKNSSCFIMSQDTLLEYLYSIVRALTILEQLRYLRHGYLNLFTIHKHKEQDKVKLLFNPFYPLECVELLQNQPNVQYFKNYFLSPEELLRLNNNKSYYQQLSSQSDIFSLGIIIITLSTLQLSDNYCYLQYSHVDAGVDEKNLNQKLTFIKQYYSKEFMKLLNLMTERDQADRIGSSQLFQKISDIFNKRKEKEKKYHHTLLRILGDKKYKTVNYKLKFQNKTNKGKVEDLKLSSEIDSDVVFRGTFGKDEGYYEIPKSDKSEDQFQKKKVPKKIQKKGSTEKKQPYKHSHSDENKDSQSTEKKKQKHQSSSSGEKEKYQKQKQFKKDYQHTIIDLSSKFKEYQNQQQQYSKQHHHKSQPKKVTSKSQQKSKSTQKSHTKLDPIIEEQSQKSSRSILKPQSPSQFIYYPKSQIKDGLNPQNDKLPFEVSLQCFPTHLVEFFGFVVPQKKCFKPQSAQQLAKTFKCQGIMIFKNIFYGECSQGRRQGLGLNIFPEGQYYYGYYDQDLQHGKGIYWWKPAQYFIGQFHYGKKLSGWMINGSKTFSGYYKNNKKTGFGVNFEQNSVFQGSWQSGKRQGQGIIFNKNGDMFKGIWRNGKRNGRGLEKKFSTKIEIEGQWKDDQQIHPVQVRYPNKHTFKGEYENGKKMGKGQYYFHNGTKFQGVFKDDDCYEGSFYFSNNSIYYGKVNKALKRDGHGTNIDENGDKYEGEWVNDMKHGSGKYETALETMTGLWKEGQLWQGSVVDSLGNYYKVQNGKMNKQGQFE